jgi:hypothetical protein
MCSTNTNQHPRSRGFGRTLGALALGLLVSVPISRAAAQTCVRCPDNANDTAIGTAFGVFAHRNGVDVNVSGQTVGSCEQLILKANVSYNAFGISGGIGAGFTGGTGRIIVPGGTSTDVTPADMSTTLVGPAPCGTTLVKQMNQVTYNITAADIAAGIATFTFQFTNGTSLLPNANNVCNLKVSASPQQSVTIAAAPTCNIAPQSSNVCVGGTASFTATPTGTGPFTFCWKKGCPGSGGCVSTNATLTISNAQLSDSSCYTLTVTDQFGCTNTCTATLVVNPPPSCNISPAAATNCVGSGTTFTISVNGGTAPYTVVLSGCTNETLTITNQNGSVNRSHSCDAVGSCTLTANITDSKGCVSQPCTATHTCVPVPSCSISPASATICTGTSTNFTVSVTGGTAPYTIILTGCTNGTVHIAAQNGSISIPLTCSGSCTLTGRVTDANGCVGAQPCTANLNCQPCVPCIKVYKQVVCTDATGTNCIAFSNDLTTQKSAMGVRTTDALGQEHCSAFCYRITVTNCSQAGIELRNLVITDTNFPGGAQAFDLSTCFPTTLGAQGSGNETASCIVKGVTVCENTENIVTATAVGVIASSGTLLDTVTAKDTNNVVIIPFDITCTKEGSTDGTNWSSNIDLPNGATTPVTYRVTVNNVSGLPLIVTINDTTFGCGTITVPLAANGSVTTNLCTVQVTCPPGTNNIVNVSAIVDTSKTNGICVYTANGGGPVTDTTRCEASATCKPPAACRVTGGGRQDDPLVCPADVRYVTHGGQVGAPVGNQVCSIDTNLPNFFLGNPCIHGRWTHVRHVQGGLEGNFHARFFDTLDCACLDTNLNPETCQYGAATVNHGVCGDRSTGPLPRPAPANKIAFTGVGDWACPNGRRESRACLFRVDIEDRGEPGNAHALASNKKENRIPDRYRIRIWVLSDSELAELNGAGPDRYLLNFRNAISACNGIDYQDGGVDCNRANSCASNDSCTAGATGNATIAFPGGAPVRLPNIDDGGELLHGNHQIHPAIKDCDPSNPTGPGLAKP